MTPPKGQPKPAHYQGSYHVRARAIRQTANNDPHTRCWRCGGLARPGDPWWAGHLNDSQIEGPLAPEHRSCNAAAGAATRERKRSNVKRPRRTELTW